MRVCTVADLPRLIQLQNEVYSTLDKKEILHINSECLLRSCLLSPNVTVGVDVDGVLVAYANMLVDVPNDENIRHYVTDKEVVTANLKTSMVLKEYRGRGFQRAMTAILIERAKSVGVELLCTVVSPINKWSIATLEFFRFICACETTRYGGMRRCVYYLYL